MTDISDEILTLIETCVMYGISEKEACRLFDIPFSDFQSALKSMPDFDRQLKLDKYKLRVKALQNIAAKILDGNVPESKYFLEKFVIDNQSTISSKASSKSKLTDRLKKLSLKQLEQLAFGDEAQNEET